MTLRPLMALVAFAAAAGGIRPALAAESYDNCTGFITTLPATLTTQGVWCLKHDVAFAPGTGIAIDVATNNVTIDCNGFKIGNLSAGPATLAIGVSATDRRNTTVRDCNIRGFQAGIQLAGPLGSHGALVEDNRVEGATVSGIQVVGDNFVVRRNHVLDIGPTTAVPFATSEGIRAHGMGDVHDNTVAFVEATGESEAFGILAREGSTVRDNRVRGVTSPIGNEYGIFANGPRIVVTGNDVIGRGVEGSLGIGCPGAPHAVRDNTVGGFERNLNSCAPDLDNLTFDLPPVP